MNLQSHHYRAEYWIVVQGTAKGHCCRILAVQDSHCESMRLDGKHPVVAAF
ncbi:hypothetical protein [Rhodobacter capsulatus]|uniref:hypothetical protein n=1 Tax=Rhodobacter capsulatus TaxID=1061 RepID=UPI000E2002C2